MVRGGEWHRRRVGSAKLLRPAQCIRHLVVRPAPLLLVEHGLFASLREGPEVAADGGCVVSAGWMEGKLPIPDPLGPALQPERGRRSRQYLWKQWIGGELRATQCDWEPAAG